MYNKLKETAMKTISTSKLYLAYMESEQAAIAENHYIDYGALGKWKSYRDFFKYVVELYLGLILHAGYSEDDAFALIEKNNFNPFAL